VVHSSTQASYQKETLRIRAPGRLWYGCYDGCMMFYRSLLFLIPAACLLAQNPAPAPKPAAAPDKPAVTADKVAPDKVVITVGDTKITAEQFDYIIDSLPEQYRTAARGPNRRDFAQNLARILILAQEGKRRKLDQAPGYQTEVDFQLNNFLAGKTFADLNSHLKPTDADLEKFYEAHKSEYEEVHARHILIHTKPLSPAQKEQSDAEALAKVQEIRKKIVDGADFATVASQESDDAGSKVKGGDLGSFKRGQMVPQFEQAAFTLKIGELSEPVKSQFGYHLIKVESRDVKPFDQVKPELEKRAGPDAAQKAVADLEKQANVTLDSDYFGPPAPPAK
jgi:peptidyl-prolyl cis-trans isomerase C